ncbi:hypothetical protein LG329_01015 [Virgibacillus necropolis]|uniref:hypothetical protein n=1 Tax=Virgibacillus necropolis TaxID=163877 RepID=UPI00384F44D8
MKKKVIALTVIAFLIGGSMTFAATNYYAKMLENQQGQMEAQIEKEYQERIEEIGTQVHHDMVMFVETERLRVLDEAQAYMKQKLDQVQTDRMNAHADAIQAEADRILEELKRKVDELTAN